MAASVSCALCDLLGSNDSKFVPNTDEAKNHTQIHFVQLKVVVDGFTEEEMLQRCFKIRQPKVEHPALSKTERRQFHMDLCKSLLKLQPKGHTTVCNLCGVAIRQHHKNMMNHACGHVDAKLFICRHCDLSLNTAGSIVRHIRQSHNVSKPTKTDFADKTLEDFDKISDRIERCFSTKYPRASGLQRQFLTRIKSGNKSKRSLNSLCRSIYIQRSKPSSLECNFCGLRISLRARGHCAKAMYQHAAAHLEVKLFKCCHCKQSVSTDPAIRAHLRNLHQIADANGGDFDDHSETFQSEHLRMIERCFSSDQVRQEATSGNKKNLIKAEALIRGCTSLSALAIKRCLFYNRLIRKVADSDGKIKCLPCSKRLSLKGTTSRAALYHAETHLQKPLYQCKVCKIQFSTLPSTVDHLKKKHAHGLKQNYVCIADEFHEEIMAMLSKCYDTAEGL